MLKHTRNLLLPFAILAFLVACGTQPPAGPTVQLTVDVGGSGSGWVTSSPGGIDTAATDTTASFPEGTVVELTAEAAAGSVFTGFSFPAGATYECEDADPNDTICVVTMDVAKSVTATFAPQSGPASVNVIVNTDGTAQGTVSSDPAGITDCADDCVAEFDVGTEITLTATATVGVFTGWTGGQCDGESSEACTFTLAASGTTVTANFADVPANAYSAVAFSLGALLIHNQERDATHWIDESGAGRDGALENGPTWTADGGPGTNVSGFFSFNGSNQRVNVGNHAILDFPGAHSLVWWERTDGDPPPRHAMRISKGYTNYRAQSDAEDATSLLYTIRDAPRGEPGAHHFAITNTVLANTWQMWMARYTGTALEIYEVVGGTATLRDSSPYSEELVTDPAANFAYASMSGEGGTIWEFPFRGDLAGAVVFGKSISTADLEALYEAAGVE